MFAALGGCEVIGYPRTHNAIKVINEGTSA
jgi:hypothetical protein